MIDASERIPAEVYEMVEHSGGLGCTQIHFALKSEKTKNTAWEEIRPEFDPKNPRHYNPWRKAHTLLYWAWYIEAKTK